MAKVCLVLMDGVGFETCITECGYLEGAVESGQAKHWKMLSGLLTISVPCWGRYTGYHESAQFVLSFTARRIKYSVWTLPLWPCKRVCVP